jgi:hypothetical protein
MKTQVIANRLITSNNMQSSTMGMDASGADMATYYLRDKIYSDKIMAVVREYVCNALDEHKKHNISRAVDFGLRTVDNETSFFVRDYAKGLSEHDIRNIFGMYFRSTKSSDNNQIGGFGIGSKAGHCYTDTFLVKSFYNGVCSTYACALGGGNSGIPVGHILKVSEEKTGETGLEVSLEVKRDDFANFYNKSRLFIRFCTASVVFHNGDEQFQPDTPVFSGVKSATGSKDRFSYRLYRTGSESWHNELLMSSGNVVYGRLRFRDFTSLGKENASVLDGHTLVVDIPIGRMSLPISRESFENTPANNKVYDEIRDMLRELVDEDMNSVSKMTMEQLIAGKDEHLIKGNIFNIYKRHAYKDIHPVVSNLNKCNSLAFEKIGNKFVCALIPNRASADYWYNKLTNHAINQGKNYYRVNECFFDQVSDKTELEEYFIFKKVNSSYFGFPKTKKSNSGVDLDAVAAVRNKLHYSYRWANNKQTALQVYNEIRSSQNLTAVSSVEEAQKQMKEKTFSSSAELMSYTFYCGNSTSNGEYKIFTRSKQMRKNLLELGLLEYNSAEHGKIYNELVKNEREKSLREQTVNKAHLSFLQQGEMDKTMNRFTNRIERAKQFSAKFQTILAEDSTRGRLLNVLNNGYYYNRVKISRNDLRKILNMK